jgi:hypothetical protein
MKKVLCILAAVAMVAVFGTSCKKQCTCENYVNGVKVGTTTVETTKSCASVSTMVETNGVKAGLSCK